MPDMVKNITEYVNYSCINCKGSHKVSDKKCQVHIKNKDIMKTMVEKRISIYVAKKEVNMQQIRPNNMWGDKPLEWPSLERREDRQHKRQESRERDKRMDRDKDRNNTEDRNRTETRREKEERDYNKATAKKESRIYGEIEIKEKRKGKEDRT